MSRCTMTSDPELVADMVHAAARKAVQRWIVEDSPTALASLIDHLHALSVAGRHVRELAPRRAPVRRRKPVVVA